MRKLCEQQLTILDELEAVSNVALIGHEEKAALLGSGVRRGFVFGDFGAELNTTTENPTLFGTAELVEVSSRIRLTRMCCERASF